MIVYQIYWPQCQDNNVFVKPATCRSDQLLLFDEHAQSKWPGSEYDASPRHKRNAMLNAWIDSISISALRLRHILNRPVNRRARGR